MSKKVSEFNDASLPLSGNEFIPIVQNGLNRKVVPKDIVGDINADEIDDGNTTNKFATDEQLTQIATNESDISSINTAQGVQDGLISDLRTDVDANASDLSTLQTQVDEIDIDGIKTYQTLAEFNAVSPVPDNGTSFKIANDPNEDNNGDWSVSGGVAVQNSFVVENVVEESNVSKGVSGKAVSDAIEYKADLVVGKNLYNKEKAVIGYRYFNNGNIEENAIYSYSEPIKVDAGQTYKSNNNIRYTCYFDENGDLVSGGVSTVVTSFTVPSGVHTVILTNYTEDIDTFQLEVGTVSTGYEPYLTKIKDAQTIDPFGVIEIDNRYPTSGGKVYDYASNKNYTKGVYPFKNYTNKAKGFIKSVSIPYSENILDENGIPKTFFFDYFRNEATPFGVFISVKEEGQTGNDRVSSYFETNPTIVKTGVEEIRLTGVYEIDIVIDWDLISSAVTLNINEGAFDNIIYNIWKNSYDLNASNLYENINPLNVYGDILPSSFKTKFNNLEDDIEIVIVGDSLIGLQESCTEREDASELPPACNYNHITYRLWNYICKNKTTADRYDSSRVTFNEFGTWEISDVETASSKFNFPNWSGEFSKTTSICKQSNTANASVSFDWDLDAFEKLNFIGRRTTDGAGIVTISVSGGNGKVEVLDLATGIWSEANGSTINQYIDASISTEGSGYSQHVRNWRTKFRRVLGATGNMTLTFSKGASTSEFLYYWGVEKWNQTTIHVTNVGRGGRGTALLRYNFLNDVVERKPNLVIYSTPLVNERNVEFEFLKGQYNEFLFDTEPSAKSLKSESNNFTDFQVLTLIPHGRYLQWDGNQAILYPDSVWASDNQIAYQNYMRMKQYIIDNSTEGISIIDIGNQLLSEAVRLGWTYEQSLTGTSESSALSFTKDGIHTNNLGVSYWFKYLAGVFNN